MDDSIVTGVDKLMTIISEKKKISVEAVSNQLGVPRSLVLEWAGMLEDQGSIEIQDKWLHSYLVLKELPKKHDQSYKQIMKPASMAKINSFEHKFLEFKKNMTDLIGDMEKELQELKKMEMRSQTVAEKGFQKVEKHLDHEEKTLEKVEKELEHDDKEITTEKIAIQDLKKEEGLIIDKLAELTKRFEEPKLTKEVIMQQMELYREKIRNLNYQRSLAVANGQDTREYEERISKYKKSYYDLAAKLKS